MGKAICLRFDGKYGLLCLAHYGFNLLCFPGNSGRGTIDCHAFEWLCSGKQVDFRYFAAIISAKKAQKFLTSTPFQDEGDHTTIVADPSHLMNSPIIVGKALQGNPILFRGTALIADKSNQLRLELLSAATTAYSFNPYNKVEEVYTFLL